MQVCVNCAHASARAARSRQENAQLQERIKALEVELAETDQAFWELAGDIRLSPIEVEVKDEFTSVIFPAQETGERQVG